MNVDISKIKITERIRKDVSKIDELAEDIKENGLLNPITIMPLDDGKYQLLAGLRRLKACESLGITEITVNCVSVSNAEHALRIEFSENEQRESFTYSETMDYARLIEEIERVKAQERKVESGMIYGRGHHKKVEDYRPQPITGRQLQTRDIVGEKIGISGRQYDRAKYVAANASTEMIQEIDEGKLSVRKAYETVKKDAPQNTVHGTQANKGLDKSGGFGECEISPACKTSAFAKSLEAGDVSPIISRGDFRLRRLAGKISEERLNKNPQYLKLKADYEKARSEASVAMVSMHEMEIKHKNQIYHLESINTMLKRRVESLETALTEASAKISELGGVPGGNQQA